MIYFLYFKFQSENGAVKFVDYMQTRSRITFETRRRICTQNAKASKVIVWSEPPIPNFSLFFFSISRKFQQNFCTIYFHAIFCACNFREITKTIYFSYFLQAPIEKRPKYFINKWTAEYAKLFFSSKKIIYKSKFICWGILSCWAPNESQKELPELWHWWIRYHLRPLLLNSSLYWPKSLTNSLLG